MDTCHRAVCLLYETKYNLYFIFNLYLPCLTNINDGHELHILECTSFVDGTVQTVIADE